MEVEWSQAITTTISLATSEEQILSKMEKQKKKIRISRAAAAPAFTALVKKQRFTGFCWDGVNFLYSSPL